MSARTDRLSQLIQLAGRPEFYMHDPARLRAHLEARGQTQACAAALIGVSPRTMRAWCATAGTRTAVDMPWQAWAALVLRTA